MSGAPSPEFNAADDRALFDRQPRESDQHWAGFVAYRDLGLSRSVEKAAIKIKKSPGHLFQVSRRWGWRVRVVEWDREVDRQNRSEALASIRQMRRRHLKLSEGMQRLALLELEKLIAAAEKQASAGQLTPGDITRLVEAATKIDRLNYEMPSEIVQTKTDVLDEEAIDARIAKLQEALAE